MSPARPWPTWSKAKPQRRSGRLSTSKMISQRRRKPRYLFHPSPVLFKIRDNNILLVGDAQGKMKHFFRVNLNLSVFWATSLQHILSTGTQREPVVWREIKGKILPTLPHWKGLSPLTGCTGIVHTCLYLHLVYLGPLTPTPPYFCIPIIAWTF